MCFSATASFTSAAVLVSAGAGALVINKDPNKRPFITLPLIFGAQQAAEGLVWMSFADANLTLLHFMAVVAFIAIAFVVWPALIPWAVGRMEPIQKRKIWFRIFAGAGLFFAIVAAYVIVTGNPRSEIVGQCLNYSFEKNTASFFPPNLHAILYFSSTMLPFFVSSLGWVKKTGLLIFSGLLITLGAWKYAVTSVWCFFAAIASFYICYQVYIQSKLSSQRPNEIRP